MTVWQKNNYSHRYNNNPFDIDRIYEDNNHRPFLANNRGELEMLVMQRRREFKPLYEMIFDGRLQINWQIYRGSHSYYDSDKASSSSMSYIDADDNRLENQIPTMIIELYKQCCDNEIVAHLDRRKWVLEYEREKEEQRTKELREEQQKLEQKRQAKRNSLINDIAVHANNWFKHEELSRYADELEAHLVTYNFNVLPHTIERL